MHILTCSCNKWFNHPPTLRNDMDLERNSGIYSVHFPGLSSRIWSTITYLPANIRHVARGKAAVSRMSSGSSQCHAIQCGDARWWRPRQSRHRRHEKWQSYDWQPWAVRSQHLYISTLGFSTRTTGTAHGETGRNYSESFVNCFPSIHGGSRVLGPRIGAAPYIPRQIARWEMTF